MNKRLIFSANSLWFLYNFYSWLMKDLQEIGYDIYVTGKSDHTVPLLKEMGVFVIEIPFESTSSNPFKDIQIIFNYIKIIRKIKPVCVLNFTIKANVYGAIAGKICSMPCISTQPGLGTVFMYNNVVTFIAKCLYKVSQKYPMRVFVLNLDDYNILLNEKLVLKNKLNIVKGSGIDIEKYLPVSDINYKNDELRLLYIGRILRDKGIYEFIAALRELKRENINYSCQFVGFVDADNVSAISIDEIKKWEEENIIKYEGFTTDVRPFIANNDIIILPSYKEGLPQSLLEASAMEKIIIATNVQGCKDVVVDGFNGFLCEPKNWKSLFDAIKKVIALSKEERILMGKNGRKYISENYEKSIVFEKYFELIKNI